MKKISKYRVEAIAEAYAKHGIFKPDMVTYSNQVLYEMQEDLRAMRSAINHLSEYISYRDKAKTTPHTFGDNSANQALNILVKRVSKYSCPSNLKDEYKSKDKCPLKENCKCFNED